MKFLFAYKRTIRPFTHIISCLFTVALPISFPLSSFFIPCLCSSTPRLPPSLSLAALLVSVITISSTSPLLFTLSRHHHLPSVFSFSITSHLFSSSTSVCCNFCKLTAAAPFLFHPCRCSCRWCVIFSCCPFLNCIITVFNFFPVPTVAAAWMESCCCGGGGGLRLNPLLLLVAMDSPFFSD